MKKLIFAVAVACVGAQLAHAEQVENWFSGGVENSSPTQSNGAWIAPTTGGEVTTNSASFTLELEYTASLGFAPTAAVAPDTNVMTRVLARGVKFEPVTGNDMPTFDDPPKTALAVKGSKYYAYANDEWVELEGATPTAAADILVEVDYKYSTAYARYAVVGDTTVYLKKKGAEDGSWLALASTPNPALISSVSFTGDGELASVRGDVQLGLFEVANVKYGTSDEAVAASQLTGGDGTIKVIRDNNEKIVVPEGTSIAVKIDTNGHAAGEIDNQSNQPTAVELPSTAVAEGNGEYVLDASVTDPTKVNITTTDETKSVVVSKNDQGKLVATVTTSDAQVNDIKAAGKTIIASNQDNSDLRDFLNSYASDVYNGANSTSNAMAQALAGTPTSGNGLPLWESYVLDLNPNDPTSKPAAVVNPTTQSTSGMVLTVPTYKATLPQSNYTVEYKLVDITANTNVVITPTQIVIPFDGDKYRVDTVIQ